MLCVEPRSTCSHCGSLAALDQRVPALPSTARFAVVPPFSMEDAVAVLFSATFVVPQAALAGVLALLLNSARTTMSKNATLLRGDLLLSSERGFIFISLLNLII